MSQSNCNTQNSIFPAIVGQERMKLALKLNTISSAIGGLLIRA